MTIKPVKNYVNPRYPTKGEIKNKPEILKTIPKRWKNNILLNVVFPTLIIGVITSCSNVNVNEVENKTNQVSPLFVHGNGKFYYNQSREASNPYLSQVSFSKVSYSKNSIIKTLTKDKPKPMLVGNGLSGIESFRPNLVPKYNDDLNQNNLNLDKLPKIEKTSPLELVPIKPLEILPNYLVPSPLPEFIAEDIILDELKKSGFKDS